MKEIFILTEVANREIAGLKFKTQLEAQSAMFDCLMEVLEDEGYGDEMNGIWDAIEEKGWYEDEKCGMTLNSGWYNRKHGGQLDWDISRYSLEV